MTCEELNGQFELYALGVLDGEEKAQVDAHLARNCAECSRHLREALGMNGLMLSMSPLMSPPKGLKRRVLASIGVERSGWTWAAVLAGTCMLALALWLSGQERNRSAELAQARLTLLQVSGERDRMLQALNFLNDPETRPVGFGKGQPAPPRGNVFVNPRSGILLIASRLPKLEAGKAYELWLIPPGGNPLPAGTFQSDSNGAAFHLLPGPLDEASPGTVAVTVEPVSGSPAPTTTPVITVTL